MTMLLLSAWALLTPALMTRRAMSSRLFISAVAFSSSVNAGGQKLLHNPSHHLKYDPFTKDVDTFVNDTLHEFLAPGLAVAVVHGDKTFSKGYVYADLEHKRPVTPRTLFYTGSTTKSFTAALASKLVYSDDEKYAHVAWNTKLADLMRDDFVLEDAWATNHITITDALSHRTGMPAHDFTWLNSEASVQSVVRHMRHLPLHNEPRTTWEYCNLMFMAVGHAIETATGEEFGVLLRKWIWAPLGMTETFFTIDEALSYCKRKSDITMSTGYLFDNDTKTYIAQPYSDIPPPNGAGSLVSNVFDYTHWIRNFLHPEDDSNPLTRQAIAEMTRPQMLMPQDEIAEMLPSRRDAYGLGLQTGLYHGYELVSHGGSIGGWKTEMLWAPELDWGIVVMQNAATWAFEVVTWKLLDDFLETPEHERFDMAGLARRMEREEVERLENARKVLYPDAGETANVGPSLPLAEYEGTYSHPAYHDIKLFISSEVEQTVTGAPLPLHTVPGQKSYLNMTITLHHVEGEYWYGRRAMGPSSWTTDAIQKAKFDIGADGKVKALGLQTEPDMDVLASFVKIA